MKVNKISFKKLYGYLDKTIDLNGPITLLVGINGSGKTSVLNLINWMITPSLPHLCVTEFREVKVEFTHREKVYNATARQKEGRLTYEVLNVTDNIYFHKLGVALKLSPRNLVNSPNLRDDTLGKYSNLSPDENEAPCWNFISKEVPNPVLIGLDRRLFLGLGEQIFIDSETRSPRRSGTELSPLDEVSRLANEEYGSYRNKVIQQSRLLNDAIMLSAFDEITSDTIAQLGQPNSISIEQIDILHQRVRTFVLEASPESGGIKKHDDKEIQAVQKIDEYFRSLRDVVREANDAAAGQQLTLLYVANLQQFQKIKKLIVMFEDYDKKAQAFYSDVGTYLDTINHFFKDCGKLIQFDKARSSLTFSVLNRAGKTIGRKRDLGNLSSGERQILILLTLIKFSKGTVFLIDEPELSLHPKWLDEFIPAVQKLMPKDSQLVLATHSPAIVGRNKDFALPLLPFSE